MNKQVIPLKSTEFVPMNECILVEPSIDDRSEKKTAGGIIIPILGPKSALERPTSGNIISIGSDISDLKIDDFVIWPMTDGIDFEFTDGDFMLLKYTSIIGHKLK